MKLTGTVEYRDLEGGLWQLASDDGKRYTLLARRSELRAVAGQRVEIEGEMAAGFGIGMAGPQFRVDSVRKL